MFTAAVGVGAVAYTAALDPSTQGWFPGCPIRAATGLWCPGCGLTRAAHHLLRGDLVTALEYNVLIVPLVVVAAVAAARWLLTRHTRERRRGTWPMTPVVVTIAVLLAHGVVRNLPGFEWLRGGAV